MENFKVERERNCEATLKKIGLEKDITGETGQNARETSPVPSSSRTSQGYTFKGPIENVINPINFQDGINTVNFNSLATFTPRQDRVEFNVQECVPSFFGRTEFIKKLHDYIWKIHTTNTSPIRSKAIVICGLGGVGKTQVVRKYIQEYKASYDHVLWINAESYTVATSNFLEVARRMPIDLTQDGKQKTDQEIMEEVYNFVCRKFALLIYDNMESFPNGDIEDDIHRILPKAVKTGWKVPAIIITSRNQVWMYFKVEKLPVFDLSESLSFLSSLEFRDCEDKRILLQKVVNICQGLPLALQQVVSFVRNKQDARAAVAEKRYTLEDFLTDVANKRKKFMKTRPGGKEYPDLFTLYEITFEHIGTIKHGELALQCLDVMAILNPDYISTWLIRQIFSHAKKKLPKALILLSKFSLITMNDDYYQMHRMIQASKIESSSLNTSNLTYMKQNFSKIIDLVHEFVENLPMTSTNVHQILNNVVQIHDQDPEISTKQYMKFQNSLAEKLQGIGNYRIAIKIHKDLVNTSKKINGNDHLETLKAEQNLAGGFQDQGKYEEAQKLCHNILQKRKDILGPNHPDTLITKNELAGVYRAQGKYEDARELYNEVLQKRNHILGPKHPDALITKNELAGVYRVQGKFEDARELYNEVLQNRNDILGPEHPDTLLTKNELAGDYRVQGKYEDARELYNEVLQKRNEILGPEHPDTLMTKNNLAGVYHAQGKYDDAQELYSEVLKIRNEILGPKHPDTLITKNNLAVIYHAQGKYDDAQELYIEVLQIQNEILGPEHPGTLLTKNNLAVVYHAQGKYDDAQELYSEVFQIQNETLGPEHPDTLLTKNNLAVVYQVQGKYDDAQELYSEVLKIRNEILGPKHPDTLMTKNNLAVVYHAQGKYDDARELYSEVLKIRNEILGLKHPDTLMTKNELAGVCVVQGKYDDARELDTEVLKRNEILGPNHPDTLVTKNHLAAVYHAQGKYYQARDLCSEVLKIRNEILGPKHPVTIITKKT